MVAAAVLGGGVTAACLIGTDVVGGDGTTTVVQQEPLVASSAVAARTGGSLTARDIYRRDAPGVVFIRARSVQPQESIFDLDTGESTISTGSGFVIDEEGHILTNAHVV